MYPEGKTIVHLLTETHTHTFLSPRDLISLQDAGIPGGAFAMRELDQDHVESLMLSDPTGWPDILVTCSTAGYLLIDGYHRWEVAKRRHLKGLAATCRTYQTGNEVIEATFRANLAHGLKASVASKGDYAYWLHLTFPAMEQRDIAARVQLTQGAVSKAIAKREEEAGEAPQPKEEEVSPEQQRKRLKKACKRFAHLSLQFCEEIEGLDDQELAQVFRAIVKRNEEKEKLTRIGRLLLQK